MTRSLDRSNCNVILIRHAEVEQKWKGICYGSLDVSLSQEGITASSQLAERLNSRRRDALKPGLDQVNTRVFHSGLIRTETLARFIALRLDCEGIGKDERLSERDFGVWQGLSWEEIYASDPDSFHDLIDRPDTYRPPGGETTTEMQQRVVRWFEEITKDYANHNIIAISHSGPIAALAGHLLGLPANQWQPWIIGNLEAIHIAQRLDSVSTDIRKLDLQAVHTFMGLASG